MGYCPCRIGSGSAPVQLCPGLDGQQGGRVGRSPFRHADSIRCPMTVTAPSMEIRLNGHPLSSDDPLNVCQYLFENLTRQSFRYSPAVKYHLDAQRGHIGERNLAPLDLDAVVVACRNQSPGDVVGVHNLRPPALIESVVLLSVQPYHVLTHRRVPSRGKKPLPREVVAPASTGNREQ